MPQSTAQIQATLDKYYEARDAVAAGQSYSFSTEAGSRDLTLADLGMIEAMITRLERKLNNPTNAAHNVMTANFNTRR